VGKTEFTCERGENNQLHGLLLKEGRGLDATLKEARRVVPSLLCNYWGSYESMNDTAYRHWTKISCWGKQWEGEWVLPQMQK